MLVMQLQVGTGIRNRLQSLSEIDSRSSVLISHKANKRRHWKMKERRSGEALAEKRQEGKEREKEERTEWQI
jgi:hypothetical protein